MKLSFPKHHKKNSQLPNHHKPTPKSQNPSSQWQRVTDDIVLGF